MSERTLPIKIGDIFRVSSIWYLVTDTNGATVTLFSDRSKRVVDRKAKWLFYEFKRLKKILGVDITRTAYKPSVRLANSFLALGISTIGDLVEKTELDFLKLGNFGRVSLEELNCLLSAESRYYECELLTLGMDTAKIYNAKNKLV